MNPALYEIISNVLLGIGSLALLIGLVYFLVSLALMFCNRNEINYIRGMSIMPFGHIRRGGRLRHEIEQDIETIRKRMVGSKKQIGYAVLTLVIGVAIVVVGTRF